MAKAPGFRSRFVCYLTIVSALCATLALGSTLGCSTQKAPPAIAMLPEFSLTKDNGETLNKSTFQGRPTVVAFFFTRCPTVCPRLIETLVKVEKSLGENAPRFLLVSVDPENDTVEELQKFRKKVGLSARFSLATGAHEEIMRITEQGFHIGVSGKADQTQENFGITHGSHFVLVDTVGNIRGYYQSDAPEKVDMLKRDLEAL